MLGVQSELRFMLNNTLKSKIQGAGVEEGREGNDAHSINLKVCI